MLTNGQIEQTTFKSFGELAQAIHRADIAEAERVRAIREGAQDTKANSEGTISPKSGRRR